MTGFMKKAIIAASLSTALLSALAFAGDRDISTYKAIRYTTKQGCMTCHQGNAMQPAHTLKKNPPAAQDKNHQQQ